MWKQLSAISQGFLERFKMFVLHVKITMKPGAASAAEEIFADAFKRAITEQPGFCDVELLRPNQGGEYVLRIAFENQEFQQQWVATELHGRVWTQLEKHFDSYTLANFTSV
jgi:heme-degrading monooxygenase HmoA